MVFWMILAKGVEGQRSEHGHELGCGPQSPTNTWGSDLRHVHLQDRWAQPALVRSGSQAWLGWERWPL